MDLGLDGRVAIVTGASAGIGRAVAQRLADEGVSVFAVARGAEKLERVVGAIVAAGGQAEAGAFDITDDDAPDAIVAACVERFGRIDILVNNAGGAPPKPLEALTAEDWNRDLALNFVAPARLAVACAPVLRAAGWGRTVHVASTSARRPDALFAPYSAAKAALVNLSVTLSTALAPHGVTSNALLVGVTETELVRANAEASARERSIAVDEVMARQLHRTAPPTGRFGTPDETAAAVAFLCSEPASWITGATLAVDGGTLRAI